jgi:hypothetical protein
MVKDSCVAARYGIGETDHIAQKTIIRLVHKFKKKGSKTRQVQLPEGTAAMPATKKPSPRMLDLMHQDARHEYRKRTKEAAANGILRQEHDKITVGPKVLDIEMITEVFKEIALQTFPAKGPEMKDWFRDDEDRLLPLIEGRNIAEQCYN